MNIAVKPDTGDNAIPLAEINPARVDRFQNDTIWPMFARLRREDPIHFTSESEYGPYWSVTRWDDIMAVDTNHVDFSSAQGIALANQQARIEQEAIFKAMGQEPRKNNAGFITMDEPEHSVHRKAVTPTVAPSNITNMAPIVRERAGQILDSLPIGTPFDWVDLVSKELTAMTLATLFDFPFEERQKLTYWSNVATVNTRAGTEIDSDEKREAVLQQIPQCDIFISAAAVGDYRPAEIAAHKINANAIMVGCVLFWHGRVGFGIRKNEIAVRAWCGWSFWAGSARSQKKRALVSASPGPSEAIRLRSGRRNRK